MLTKILLLAACLGYVTAAPLTAELVGDRSERAAFPMTMDLSTGAKVGNEVANDVIQEGKSILVTFRLNYEPLCPESSAKCTVNMILTNSRPDEIALSKCYVSWDVRNDPEWCCENCEAGATGPKKMCAGWEKPQVVEITTVEDFVDDGEKNILITTEALTSEATEFYHAIDLPDVKIKTPNKGTAECSSTTDPNYRQWDGGRFTVNTAGTYSLWKAPKRDWEVQSRVNSAGMNCGLAMRDGCDRIVFDRCSGAFSMRKYFDQSGDPDLQPVISREGSDSWVVTSKRSGAQVKVVQRIVVIRVGWTSCGWSGCVRSPINSRREWLDLYLRAPGADWGYHDTVDGTGAPHTTGICGVWDNNKGNDLQISGSTKTAASYAATFKVNSNTLFDATPAVCLTEKQPLTIEPKECSVTPRRIQKPVISIFDIEDITELLKNSIEGQEEEDEAASFVFDSGVDFEMPQRSESFEKEAMAFCKEVLLDTSAYAQECKKIRVTAGGTACEDDASQNCIDLDQFVQSCYNDIFWQGQETDCEGCQPISKQSTANTLAAATYDSMENFCIESRAKSTDFQRFCSDENAAADKCEMVNIPCEGDATGNCEVCVGTACTIEAKDDLKSLMNQKCPNSCGANSKRSADAGGTCVEDDRGINVCKCTNPKQWGGVDCTVEVGEVRPHLAKLVPRGCATNKGVACTNTVVVQADTEMGTLFAKPEDSEIICEVNGKAGKGTLLDTTQIQCDLDASHGHSGSATALFHSVKVALNGKTFSSPLHFCYHNSECTECDSKLGETIVLDGMCSINGKCYQTGDDAPGNLGGCRVCDPTFSTTDWKYLYEKDECAPELDAANTIFVNELAMLQSVINLGNPVATKFNAKTHGDTVNPLVFEFTEATTMFEFSTEEPGLIILKESLDFETTAKYTLNVKVSQGGLSDTGTVVIQVEDADEAGSFVGAPYAATVVENTAAGELLTVKVDDPDGGAFADFEYDLEFAGSKKPFAISADGVVSTTKPLDFEDRKVWNLVVTAKSAGGSKARATLTVDVTNVAEAPTFVGIDRTTIAENSPMGTVVATVTVTDPDGPASADTHTLELEGGDGWLALENGKVVVAKDGLDYEAGGSKSLDFSVTATDADGLSFKEELGVRVIDANDAPGTITVNKMVGEKHPEGDAVTPLTEINEVQSVGVPIAFLEVEDQDQAQTHEFAVVGSSPFAVVGSTLVLKEPLDYEALVGGDGAEISVTITATDDAELDALESAPQTFTFTVTDGPDIPRDFKFIPSGVVPEMSNVGKEVGTLVAVDQDEDASSQKFTLGVKAGGKFRVEAASDQKCEVVVGTGTVCRAKVFVDGPLDFESNMISADEAAIKLQATAAFGAGQSQSTECTDACPMIAIANVADRPSGFKFEGASATSGGDAAVAEGDIIVGTLAAIDDDDLCQEDLPGCSNFVAAGSYDFELMTGNDVFELAPSCGRSLTVAQRAVGGNECDVRVRAGKELKNGEEYSIKVKVTDQDNLAAQMDRKIAVSAADVTISIMDLDGQPLTSLSESHIDYGVVAVGVIKVTNWVSELEPEAPVVSAGPFSVSEYSGGARRSRRSRREFSFGISVDTAALDHKKNEDIEFTITLGSVSGPLSSKSDFPGLAQTFTVSVIRHKPTTSEGNQICVGTDCDWAFAHADRASSGIYLSAFAPVGTVLATVSTASVRTEAVLADAAQPTYSILSESPQYDLIEFDPVTRSIKTSKQASLMNGGTGLGSRSDVEIVMRAVTSDGKVTDFTIAVEIEYCPTPNPVCNADNTEECVELHDGGAHFECVCVGGWMGETCDSRDSDFGKSNVDGEDLSLESADLGDDAASTGMSNGGVAGVVIAVVLILALVVGIALMHNARKIKNAEEFAKIRAARRDERLASVNHNFGGAPTSQFVTGAENPTYGWYKPQLTKQSAYEQLSTAEPGNFVVRDKVIQGNNGFSIHFKSQQHIVRDAYIGAGDSGHGVRVMSAAGAAPEPTFHDIPALVDHYASLNDMSAPIQLNLDNPIYFDPNALAEKTGVSVDIYSNTAVKNTAVSLDGPSLPSKGPNYKLNESAL